ncbi:A24 family peptidase [Arthrobacter sp. H5]|uniref:prepilin peptidase n=1 Tax=Arthrobacter sp. H5 TaxID=1267973 RepID=UPI000685C26E|nr:A24 family peptidase [Arthrobacter sp. H5]
MILLTFSSLALGTAAGWLLFPLSERDPSTTLPRSWRMPTAAFTGILCGLLAWRIGPSWDLVVFLVLPLFGVLLGAIDLRTRLLPNALVMPFLLLTVLLMLPVAGFEAGWSALMGALVGGASMFVIYLILALISPSGIGMGDVKLAGVLGMYGGYAGFLPWAVMLLGGFILGGVVGIALLFGGASRQSAFPFGPPMLAAAVVAMLA